MSSALPKKLCQQFMPLLVKNVHLISDPSHLGSFTMTEFCQASVYRIKWSPPAMIIPLQGVLSTIIKSPLHLQRVGCSWVSPPQITGQHFTTPAAVSISLKASSPWAFPCPPKVQLSGRSSSRLNSATLRPPPWLHGEKDACAYVCVCPWDLLVKCFPFPGDIFDTKIKGQRGKQTYFPLPPLLGVWYCKTSHAS